MILFALLFDFLFLHFFFINQIFFNQKNVKTLLQLLIQMIFQKKVL